MCEKVRNTSVILVALIISITVLALPYETFAFEEKYVDDQYSWYKKGISVNIKDGSFSGQIGYITDTENGCVYFHITFDDKEIKAYDNSDIQLLVDFKNSSNSYSFSFNEDGFTNDSNGKFSSAIDLYQNFSKLKCKNGYGELFAGFQLKNAQDKKSLSNFTLSFVKSNVSIVKLLEDIEFDMYVAETTKATTTKTTTTKTTTTKKTTTAKTQSTADGDSTKNATDSNSSQSKNSSTKFTPSGTTAKNNAKSKTTANNTKVNTANKTANTSKFEADAEAISTQEVSAQADENGIALSGEDSENSSQTSNNAESNTSFKRTDKANAFIIIATITLALGIGCILFALLSGKYQITRRQLKTNENTETNTTDKETDTTENSDD